MGEEQWRIPPKQDETWNQLPLGIAGDVVETSEVFDPAQHGKMGTPASHRNSITAITIASATP